MMSYLQSIKGLEIITAKQVLTPFAIFCGIICIIGSIVYFFVSKNYNEELKQKVATRTEKATLVAMILLFLTFAVCSYINFTMTKTEITCRIDSPATWYKVNEYAKMIRLDADGTYTFVER